LGLKKEEIAISKVWEIVKKNGRSERYRRMTKSGRGGLRAGGVKLMEMSEKRENKERMRKKEGGRITSLT